MKKWLKTIALSALAVAAFTSASYAYNAGIPAGYNRLDTPRSILLAQAGPGLSAANNDNPAPQLPHIPVGPYSVNLSGNFALGLNLNYDVYLEGARDYYNGQWLAGWGKELAPLTHNGNEVLFVSAYNLYNADEAGRGVIGGAVGCRPIALINEAARIAGLANGLIPTPKCDTQCDGLGANFLKDVAEYSSIEVGGGYRMFSSPPGVSRFASTIGGQIHIPLSTFFKGQ